MASVVCGHGSGRSKPAPGLADIFDRYLGVYLKSHRLSGYQHKVVSAIRSCRTSALGGHLFRCNKCGFKRPEYDSCRNRHCPKCQGYQTIKWVAARLAELLPIPYFHSVFTMPESLNALVLYNKELLYDLFFKATSHALNAFAQDPRFLGARIGFIGVLHTWGQALNQHIHIHYIVTGGGLSNACPEQGRRACPEQGRRACPEQGRRAGVRWVNLPYRKKFLFPAKAVSMRVRREFARLLWKAYREDKLVFPDELAYLAEPSCFDRYLNKVAWQNWLCYMKEPFGSPEVVVKYIGRYTHRVAIADSRLQSISDGKIRFAYKRYHNNKVYPGTMTLDYDEFIRRFLLHVIPAGFKRIRHFGFLASGCRTRSLELARGLLAVAAEAVRAAQSAFELWFKDGKDGRQCPECQQGIMEICEVLGPRRLAPG